MFHLLITRLAQGTALLGGLVLIALVCLVCASIFGREIGALAVAAGFGDLVRGVGLGPVKGDYELVEVGMAFAVFSFLPLTQLNGAHARVDIFTAGLGPRANAALSAFWSVVMALVILLITWRLFAGLQDKLRYGETTFLLQFPVWWGYAACLAAACIACIVSLYCAALNLTGKRGE
ncbi:MULTISPECIES: TRAP transporter small permease [unclassified Yoonia]|uniref:TRAP transporter small permease n=1 Tax=unclassified Yoonia TaxID=2629118 RepID=UPI002AFEBEFC|nr:MULTISPECIES: TRAP transporter small permease subunit [unclassified Yoonia]